MLEKRKFVRLAWKAKVKAYQGDRIKQVISSGMLKNISKKGFAFVSEDKLHRGMAYDFQIGDIQELPINLRGLVVRARESGTVYSYGVQIDHVPLLDRIRLNQFLSARESKLKLRFVLTSLLLGAGAGLVSHWMLGWSHGPSFVAFFVVSLIHILFPPY